MTFILIWLEEGRTEDTWSKLDQEWKSIRWAQVHLSPISCHIVPEGEKQLCNSSSKSRRKGAEESLYAWCACREHPVNEILRSSDDWSLQNHCSIRRKLARHSQPPASSSFLWKSPGGKTIESGVLQNTGLSPTIYGVFQDQNWERKKKKLCNERAELHTGSLNLWCCESMERSCGPSPYPENIRVRGYVWGRGWSKAVQMLKNLENGCLKLFSTAKWIRDLVGLGP